MNRYHIEIPYSCNTYGRVKGTVYANSESEAREKAQDFDNVDDPEYLDNDTDNTEHYYSDMEIELVAENVPENEIPDYLRDTETFELPNYYLNEINLI